MAPQKSNVEPPQDVPIFLRKTYHMIDTCDPNIASWSEDGETFIVKDPVKFERTIIPQFFKHSKFSSFVRQLNFYSFRKIKNLDTLRIDPKLEKETANYWRFRHEKFLRGRPELLTEIKRMNGAKTTSTASGSNSATNKASTASSGKDEDKNVKSEVTALKKRIEEMTKNIDELTSLVQQVSLKQEEQDELTPEDTPSGAVVGSKRKKVDPSLDSEIRPDDMLSGMLDLEDMALPSPPPLPPCETDSDVEFVDTLFTAFKEEGDDAFQLDSSLMPLEPEPVEDPNRPDPELMKKLGEALTLLPRETQEMIINRLIAAITEPISAPAAAAAAALAEPKMVPSTGKAAHSPQSDEDTKQPALPLAAATLGALLHHCGTQMQGKRPGNAHKSIPVIPVHG